VIQRVDPLSVLRVSAVFYVCLYAIGVLAGVVLWLVARAAGVVANVESFIGDLFALEDFHFVAWRILRAVALAGAAFVVLASAANLAGALLYNLISRLVGGITIITAGDEAPAAPVAGAPGDAPAGHEHPVGRRRVIV
jgi:hypothetical protein